MNVLESNTVSDLDWLFQPEHTDGQLNVQSLELPDIGILIVWDFQIIDGDAEAEGLRATDGSSSSGESPLPIVIKAFSAKHLILTTHSLIQMLPDVIAPKKLLNTLSLSNA